MSSEPETPEALAHAVLNGERRALARAITLVESERANDEEAATRLLEALLPHTGKSLRVGVSGPPGAGKSTLIDALGRYAIAGGSRVSVLAVDPSSHVSGGSILGDKTRMGRLAAEPSSFIRPSPSRGQGGGLAPRTREALLVCEAAGFEVVVVETVGVGQGEVSAVSLVDCLLLVLQAGAGDELSSMKRGILEAADVIAVNKADGAERERAESAAAELGNALGLVARRVARGSPRVLAVSALTEQGVPELWAEVQASIQRARETGALETRRRAGLRDWLGEELQTLLRERVRASARAAHELDDLVAAVEANRMTPRRAARRWLELLED